MLRRLQKMMCVLVVALLITSAATPALAKSVTARVNTSSAKVYKKASTHSSKKTTLSKGQHVIVYQVKGNWAYIKTLGGTGGFVKKSALKKAK